VHDRPRDRRSRLDLDLDFDLDFAADLAIANETGEWIAPCCWRRRPMLT
jgi:hypothetical protein